MPTNQPTNQPTYHTDLTHHITLLQSKILLRKLKRGRSKKEMKSQPKHPWCKKVAAKNLKKAMLKKM